MPLLMGWASSPQRVVAPRDKGEGNRLEQYIWGGGGIVLVCVFRVADRGQWYLINRVIN